MATESKQQKSSVGSIQRFVWPIIAVVCLAAGIAFGHFVLGGGTGVSEAGSPAGVTTVGEDKLDTVVGSYTYNGTSFDVTIRDVIEETSSLEAAKTEEGAYSVPSADSVLSYMRNNIILNAAKEAGITLSDKEVADYALQQLGSSDYASLAANYGLDEETVKSMITDSAIIDAYRVKVTGVTLPTPPVAPTEPKEGKEDEETADYASYIIDLAGDEWDAKKETWADEKGEYATALANYHVTNDAASYEAAQAAYYVASQAYTTKSEEMNTAWKAYYNELFSQCVVTLYSLVG